MQKFGYKVSINSYCESSYRETDDNDDYVQYGSHSSSYSNSFDRISIAKDYPDVVSTHDLKDFDKCYVVWFEFSTGDSFGSSTNSEIETAGVFKDRECAAELAKAIKDFTENSDANTMDRYRFEFKTSDGQEFVYPFARWIGYFETLGEVHIEETYIN